MTYSLRMLARARELHNTPAYSGVTEVGQRLALEFYISLDHALELSRRVLEETPTEQRLPDVPAPVFTSPQLGRALELRIQHGPQQKILVIKILREEYAFSLKEAKDLYEATYVWVPAGQDPSGSEHAWREAVADGSLTSRLTSRAAPKISIEDEHAKLAADSAALRDSVTGLRKENTRLKAELARANERIDAILKLTKAFTRSFEGEL